MKNKANPKNTIIICPNCGIEFDITPSQKNSIITQIRDELFDKEVESRANEKAEYLRIETESYRLEKKDRMHEKETSEYKKRIAYLEKKLDTLTEEKDELQDLYRSLQTQLTQDRSAHKIELIDAVKKSEGEKQKLENQIEKLKLENDIKIQNQKTKYDVLLKQKDEQIDFYKDLKTRMSTKMIGESLEQHCENEFNKMRMTAFPAAYFEKDNDIKTGSKGDYIYKEFDNGVELLSIMFEMKNESDTTSTKHKNEHFFKELDKDRREKNCEYAVLVSMLEPESDLYNSGIVDVSYKFEKMYVVRPQCFLTIISILRNASKNAFRYKQELQTIKNQNIDISNFENNLMNFKMAFSKNYDLAHKHFNSAIAEIDKTMASLQRVKDYLQKSDNQYRLANDKADSITIKKLTKNSPTMKERFKNFKKERENSLDIELSKDISYLGISKRNCEILRSGNIYTIGDLCSKTQKELLGIPNFGRKSLASTVEILEERGLEIQK